MKLKGIRQVSYAPIPLGNIGQAVALKLLNNNTMYNNFYESNLIGVRIPLPGETIAQTTSLPITCTPNWQCTAWSVCSILGKQSRNCTDINNCGTLTGKPNILLSCTPPARTVASSPVRAVAALPTRTPISVVPVVAPVPVVSTPTPVPVYPPIGSGNALPLEPEPSVPIEADQAAAAEAQKKQKQKWTYIVLTILVLLIIAYFYFKKPK